MYYVKNIISLDKQMNAIYATNIFIQILTVKDALLYPWDFLFSIKNAFIVHNKNSFFVHENDAFRP